MKIAKLETFDSPYVCFVKATADTGDVGWGQTSTYQADITAEIFHRQVAPYALGTRVEDLEDTLRRTYEREHKFPGSYLRRARPRRVARSDRGSYSYCCQGARR